MCTHTMEHYGLTVTVVPSSLCHLPLSPAHHHCRPRITAPTAITHTFGEGPALSRIRRGNPSNSNPADGLCIETTQRRNPVPIR